MNFEPNSSTPSDDPSLMHLPPTVSHKHPAGRKKFHETRHPIFRGVRQRNGSKWVSEVREPQKKSRIWLGTFPCPEMAAIAYDVAALALRGKSAQLNFPNLARLLPRPESSLAKDIQKAATTAAHTFRAVDSFLTVQTPVTNCKHRVADGKVVFVDDEALFNMPSLLANMAEGLLIPPPPPPPPVQNEMNYDDLDGHVGFSLWSD